MNELTLAADTMRGVVRKTWWIPLIQGIASAIIGVLLLTNPATTLISIALFLGAYWLVGGIFDIIWAIRARNEIQGEGWLILWGILSILFGIYVLLNPGASAVALVLAIAILGVVGGIAMVIFAFRLRGVA